MHPKAAPGLADAQFRLSASPAPAADLAVTLTIEQMGAYLASTEQTVTIPKSSQTSATGTFPIAADYSLASGDLTATVTGGERNYLPAPAPANAATVQVAVADLPIVAQWAEECLHGGRGQGRDGHVDAEDGGGHAEAAGWTTRSRCSPRDNTAVDGDDFTAVDVELTVRPERLDGPTAACLPRRFRRRSRRWTTASSRATSGSTSQVSALRPVRPRSGSTGSTNARPGSGTRAAWRRCATEIVIDDDEILSVTGVTVSSTPATTGGTTYLGGEAIEFTATFTAPVTVTGTPTFAFMLGEAERQADYATGSESLELVFSYIVKAGEIDTDGISWECERARAQWRDHPADD